MRMVSRHLYLQYLEMLRREREKKGAKVNRECVPQLKETPEVEREWTGKDVPPVQEDDNSCVPSRHVMHAQWTYAGDFGLSRLARGCQGNFCSLQRTSIRFISNRTASDVRADDDSSKERNVLFSP